MMGTNDWFGGLFGAIPEGDVSFNALIVKRMIEMGLAPVIIEPNGKKAICTLNAAARKKANEAEQDAAKARGVVNWEKARHACGHKHALTEVKQVNHKAIKELLAGGANIGVSFEHCTKRVIVIDVDTDAERRGFLADCEGLDESTPLTVTSPGVFDATAEVWKHKDGGHLWFDVPDGVELPESKGKARWCGCHGFNGTILTGQVIDGKEERKACPSSWVAYWGTGYVLLPPSVRKEGPYRVTGGVLTAPTWLTDLLSSAPEMSASDIGELNDDDEDGINAWARGSSWDALLTEDGWNATGDIDRCGCKTWTRPGATNEKSATAHGPECGKFNVSTGHGPIHFWSDAVRIAGKETCSMLTYVAHTRFDGDMKAAMTELGIESKGRERDEDDGLAVLGELPVSALSSSARTARTSTSLASGGDSGKGDAPSAGGDGADALTISPEDFWTSREIFAHIREWSIAAYVSPWAMLGAVLAYATALTPPRVTLPDNGSLNLYVGLVGKSGTGKDRARNAARRWMLPAIEASALNQRPIGSGQGVTALYMQKVKEKDAENGDRWVDKMVRESSMATIPEIDGLYSHARQQASTLMETLRSAWMAEPIGGAYKNQQLDISVPDGSYRFCLIAGIQPAKARVLLDDSTGGLPQRFVWMRSTDPTLPRFEYGERPPYPEPWEWKPPVRLDAGTDPFAFGERSEEPQIEIELCESALRLNHYINQARVTEDLEIDDIARHDLLGRMKIAAAVALLEERTSVTEEDWELSATIQAVSNKCRARTIADLAMEDTHRIEAERKVYVETVVAAEKAKTTSALDRACVRIRKVLHGEKEGLSRGRLARALSGAAREQIEEALSRLHEEGVIESEMGSDGHTRYKIKVT